MLNQLLQTFATELGRDDVEVLLGADNVSAHGKPPRIIWVPSSDTFSPPVRIGGNPRALYTRNATVTIHIWAVDVSATEELLHQTVVALHRAFSGPGFELQTTQWLDDKGAFIQRGEVVLLNVSIQVPVHDRWETTAKIRSVEATKEFAIP